MFVMLQHQIEGARVAAWTKHAAGPATPAGKPLGATPGVPPPPRLLAVHKRAYRRAGLRASQSETGYTWYRSGGTRKPPCKHCEAFRGACSDWRLRTRSVASAIAPA